MGFLIALGIVNLIGIFICLGGLEREQKRIGRLEENRDNQIAYNGRTNEKLERNKIGSLQLFAGMEALMKKMVTISKARTRTKFMWSEKNSNEVNLAMVKEQEKHLTFKEKLGGSGFNPAGGVGTKEGPYGPKID